MREREKIAHVKRLHREGAAMESILLFLRKEDVSKVGSVRLLHLATGMSLTESKRTVFLSKTWSDCFVRDEASLDSLLVDFESKADVAA